MIAILVCQRGWVLVGEVSRDGSGVMLTRGRNIRRWGTKRGLGEIADGGPTKQTELDLIGRKVRLHQLQIILEIECNEAKWISHLE
jgi:hypothetical protein